MEMSPVEFCEALVRVADACPKENLRDYYPLHVSSSPWNIDKKLESIIVAMI